MFIRTPYNYDTAEASWKSGLECKLPTRTNQSQAEEADINTIVRRFHITGKVPTNVRAPMQGDFTEVKDFQGAMDSIVMAKESFMQMTSEVRNRFNNNPAEFVDFCVNPENVDEMRKMGLAVPKPAEPVVTSA